MSTFNPRLIPSPSADSRTWEAREKPERGTPLGLIRKPLAEPRMEPIKAGRLRSDNERD
jgi:hypothetical protein